MRGLVGVPDGLTAWAQPSRTDGTFAIDAAGRPKVFRILLRSEVDAPTRPPGLLADGDWAWATSAPRRWTSAVKRLGDNAGRIGVVLARAGCIAIAHDFRDGAIKHPPRGWVPDLRIRDAHSEQQRLGRQARSSVVERGKRLREQLISEWPGVAQSLLLPDHDPRLGWIVSAADDLVAGRSHDGVRAFVQHHAEHNKARDDLPQLLRSTGWEAEALSILGVHRSPYIGIGGPVHVEGGPKPIDLAGWSGPHDFRLPPGCPITLRVESGTADLLVIENRQAAEALCDAYPGLAVLWCHGQPSDSVLDLIVQVALGVSRVLICCDADLGGARIASRIYDHLPASVSRCIIDAGTADHPVGRTFSRTARTHLLRLTRRQDDIGTLAQSCLQRGYAVEQEAPVRAALRSVLSSKPGSPAG